MAGWSPRSLCSRRWRARRHGQTPAAPGAGTRPMNCGGYFALRCSASEAVMALPARSARIDHDVGAGAVERTARNRHRPHAAAVRSAKSLIFPLPVAGSQPQRTPLPWDPAQPCRGLGFRAVAAGKAAPVITELPVQKA